jgi:alpha-glucoside transport system permease protein
VLKLANALIAVVAGVGGAMLLYYSLNLAVERLPTTWEHRLKPYVFVGPAVLVVLTLLVYPTVYTAYLSFFSNTGASVGLGNYTSLFGDAQFRQTLINNLLWILVVPALAVVVGLAVATLADKLRERSERIAKSVIFLPMAISFVGAGTIWGFIYAARPAGRPQIGILNAIAQGLGFDPVSWLLTQSYNLNDFLLMAIMIWLQAGFAMVLLSAAIKGVPTETIEAARVDGASELQIFWRVIVPQIRGTVAVVFTTILILVMKVFDIVYVLTGGQYETDVVGNRFFTELFNNRNSGQAAAIVVVLLIAVIPAMYFNIRRFRAEEALR